MTVNVFCLIEPLCVFRCFIDRSPLTGDGVLQYKQAEKDAYAAPRVFNPNATFVLLLISLCQSEIIRKWIKVTKILRVASDCRYICTQSQK